jgi:hypothetical protein
MLRNRTTLTLIRISSNLTLTNFIHVAKVTTFQPHYCKFRQRWPIFLVLAIELLSNFFCHSFSWNCCPALAAPSWLSCHDFPFVIVVVPCSRGRFTLFLSQLFLALLTWLSWRGCTVVAVLSWLSWMFWYGCPIMAALRLRSCHCYF